MDKNLLIAHIVGGAGQKIPFDRNFSAITGSICSAILLQQMLFHWQQKGGQTFYKFTSPCNNAMYVYDDSWEEELGIGVSAFRAARDKVAKKAKNKEEAEKFMEKDSVDFCFIYYNDRNNVTWYMINLKAVEKVIMKSIEMEQERNLKKDMRKSNFSTCENRISGNEENASLLYTENTKENNITSEFFDEKNELNVKEAKEPRKYKKRQPKLPYDKNSKEMSIDFYVGNDIIDTAEKLGYERQDALDEAGKFQFYYKQGKGKTTKKPDWRHAFLHEWLLSNYRNGYIKRNGQFYKSSASEERVTAIEKILDSDMFAEFEGIA